MTLREFKLSYQDIDFVKGDKEQEKLFDSICYLIQKNNDTKTTKAIEMLFDTYDIKIDLIRGVDPKNNLPLNKSAMNLLNVPSRVAKSIIEKAYRVALDEKREKYKKEDAIIDLLK